MVRFVSTSCLIIVFVLLLFQTFTELTHKTMASNKRHAYQTWCNKTTHETLCVSTVQSDPRKDLKSSPQGLVVILMNAAQAKANTTRLFINDALSNQTSDGYDKSKSALEGCLLAYNLDWVSSALKVDVQQVSDKQRCIDLFDTLRNVGSEVTYDCEWDLPSPVEPSTLSQMYEKVESLASIIEAAQQILSLIGCSGS